MLINLIVLLAVFYIGHRVYHGWKNSGECGNCSESCKDCLKKKNNTLDKNK